MKLPLLKRHAATVQSRFTTMMAHPINQEEAAHGYMNPEGVTAT